MNSNQESRARATLAYLFSKLAALYTGGAAASLSRGEAMQLAASLSFALELNGATDADTIHTLCSTDPETLYHQAQSRLSAKTGAALRTWRQVVATMPPIRNVALRDTLASIANLRRTYDTYFAAHEVSCRIDYPLSQPISNTLRGIDYVQAWLDQLLCETQWIAQFTPESCIAALEQACPDYRGLHVNLYDLLKPRERELARNAEALKEVPSRSPQQS